MAKTSREHRRAAPPALDLLPLVHASEEVAQWLEHYWHKLQLPRDVADRLAVTDDRQEFALWTGRRLNPMALGCYCYLPNASGETLEGEHDDAPELLNAESPSCVAPATALQPALPGFSMDAGDATEYEARPEEELAAARRALARDHRHLIFIEPGLLPLSIEVTVAHELIHLSDRVQGNPRKHRCHGYDSISVDEAALTGRDPEFLRTQLREETARREVALRRVQPYRYIYVCPVCQREYPRVRRYTRPVSCGRCDHQYNPAFTLQMREIRGGKGGAGERGDVTRAVKAEAQAE